ncbi:hypothetical protein [Stenotrophomonas maltophilia]|uniref:hypothetical protein n=1 Tax=Stenotrophomonas maltophilia TaxID=40324 RepID=UPI00131221EF|nr:hypothetical protein [Stenotrophomonas maltophilia]
MSSIQTTSQFLFEDLAYVARNMRPDEVAQDMAFNGTKVHDVESAILRMVNVAGPKVVMFADGLPILCGGFYCIRPGVWEGWQAGTMAGWDRYWRSITKVTRKINDRMLADPDVHRIQLCAMAGREKTFEWYERGLGYRREATLHRYCASGADAVMFARVKEAA